MKVKVYRGVQKEEKLNTMSWWTTDKEYAYVFGGDGGVLYETTIDVPVVHVDGNEVLFAFNAPYIAGYEGSLYYGGMNGLRVNEYSWHKYIKLPLADVFATDKVKYYSLDEQIIFCLGKNWIGEINKSIIQFDKSRTIQISL